MSRQCCTFQSSSYNLRNNTRQGYARKSSLKPAGYLFLEVVQASKSDTSGDTNSSRHPRVSPRHFRISLRHPREGGDPLSEHMDSRLRGDDGLVVEDVP